MTAANRELLLAFAREWMAIAMAASTGSRTMGGANVPIQEVAEALSIAKRALELAARLEGVARALPRIEGSRER